MSGTDRHAAFYRGYLPDDRSLLPLTIALATTVALWLLLFLAVCAQPWPQTTQPAAHPSTPTQTSIY